MLGRDVLEVDQMHKWPHLPRSLAGSQKIGLNLGSNGGEVVTCHESKVGEEHGHEDRAPNCLVDGNLGEDLLGTSSLDLRVKPVVEIVSTGAVVDESE